MSVELDPTELGFRRPFTHEVTQILRLKNPYDETVVFKVKTTAPRQYCVRPNSGTIDSGEEVEIQVLLQAMKEDPPPDARCRDKFLVQSALIGKSQGTNVATIWPEIEKTNKDAIKERKIRVTFLPAAHDPTPTPHEHATNGFNAPDEAPPAYTSPSPIFGSPSASAVTPASGDTKSVPSEKPSTLEAASTSISKAASSAQETLQQQLDAAKATISQLRSQADTQGLRQRKSEAVAQDSRERVTTGTTGMGVQTQPAEGVPVQIVAALCLLSFLLAYFFF